MERTGWSKVDNTFRIIDADEIAVKTMNLRVTTTANPKRQSLTQSKGLKTKLKPTPKTLKKSQRSQPARESTRVRRIEKIGSLFKIILFATKSAKSVTVKREIPRIKLLIE
jgi:hypothetical protein